MKLEQIKFKINYNNFFAVLLKFYHYLPHDHCETVKLQEWL